MSLVTRYVICCRALVSLKVLRYLKFQTHCLEPEARSYSIEKREATSTLLCLLLILIYLILLYFSYKLKDAAAITGCLASQEILVLPLQDFCDMLQILLGKPKLLVSSAS